MPQPMIRTPSEELALAGVNGGNRWAEGFIFARFDLNEEVDFTLLRDDIHLAMTARAGITLQNATPLQPQIARGPAFPPGACGQCWPREETVAEVEEAEAEAKKGGH